MTFKPCSAGIVAIMLMATTSVTADINYEPEREVPGKANDHAFLGSIYDMARDEIVNQLCAKGNFVDTQGDTEAVYDLKAGMSFQDAFRTLNGSLNGEMNYPLVRADAGTYIAREYADTASSKSFHMSFTVKPKKRVIDPESIWLTEYGKRVVSSGRNIYEACGDAFLTGKEFGGSIHASLRFEFRNDWDKQKIGGHLKVDWGPAKKVKIVKLEGSLDYLDEEAANSVKISIKVNQFGGDPLQLSKVIVPDAIHCKLTNASKCLEAFEAVSRYAKYEFPKQFTSLEKYNTTKYFVNTYKKMGVDELVAQEEYPQISLLTKKIREEIEVDFEKNLMWRKQAETLLNTYGGAMKTKHKDKVTELSESAFNNSRILADISRHCYNKPFLDECKTYKDLRYPEVKSIDTSLLRIAAETSKFYKCENARLAVEKTGAYSKKMLLQYRRAGWAPIFEDNRYPKTVEGFLSCAEALPTYGPYFENKD